MSASNQSAKSGMPFGRLLVLSLSVCMQCVSQHIGVKYDTDVSQFVWFDILNTQNIDTHMDTSDNSKNKAEINDERKTKLINEFVFYEFLPRYVSKAKLHQSF